MLLHGATNRTFHFSDSEDIVTLVDRVVNILKYIVFLLILLPLSPELRANDWGDWGKETEQFVDDLSTEHPGDSTDRIEPLNAQEQAVFRELDNSSLTDYDGKLPEEWSEEESLFESLERLEQQQLKGKKKGLGTLPGQSDITEDQPQGDSLLDELDSDDNDGPLGI